MKWRIKIVSILFLFIYIPRCKPIITYAKEAFNIIVDPLINDGEETLSEPTSEDALEEDGSLELSYEEPKEETLSEPTSEEEDSLDSRNPETWARFILEHPEGYPEISDEEYSDLYNSLFYIDEEDLKKEIKNKIIILIYSNEINNPLNEVTTSSGNTPQYYSDIEAKFLDSNKNRSSSEWDEIIRGREEILNDYPSGTLAWLLANNYQTYALNYLEQTNEAKSILYLYMKSIDYTQKSLEYDMDIENKLKRINYIKARYKDIGDCKILENDVRLRAYEICNAIDDALYEVDMDISSSNEIKE